MFDIGWSEILLIAVVALVAVGPKELPGAIMQMTRWLRQAKGMAREFQSHVDEMIREVELDDLRKSVSSPVEIGKAIENTVDPDHVLRDAFDPAAVGLTGSPGSPPEDEPAAPVAIAPPVAVEAPASVEAASAPVSPVDAEKTHSLEKV